MMHRLLAFAFVLLASSGLVLANPASLAPSCTEPTVTTSDPGTFQLAQGSCRGHCSTMRGYCLSTCRDSQCRAICNDRYQSCLDSCGRR
jgi:hypothetical protein